MLALRRALLALFALGIVFAALDVAITLTSRHEPDRAAVAVFQVLIGLSFIGVGISAWWRRPLNRFGMLMTIVGFAWFIAGLRESNSAGLFTVGTYLGTLYIVVAVHMVLTFPSGRLETTAQRAVVTAGYFAILAIGLPYLLLGANIDSGLVGQRPGNAFEIVDAPDLAAVFGLVEAVVGVVCLGAAVVLVLGKLRHATPPQRRQQLPMAATGVVLVLFLTLWLLLDAVSADGAAKAASF